MTSSIIRPDDWEDGYRYALDHLLGQRIEKVIYTDLTDEDGTPLFRFEPTDGRHSLCYGLVFVTSDQIRVGFTWDWDGDDYRLCVERSDGGIRLRSAQRFEASADPEWEKRKGQVITAVTFSVDTSIPDASEMVCDCRLDFEGAPPVWITARDEEMNNWANMDNILVFFDRDQARQAGVRVDA